MNTNINILPKKSTSVSTPEFHGSDMEKIAAYYQIPEESIVNFAANVNPLGISQLVKEHLVENLDIMSQYPDRDYTSLRNTLGLYCNTHPEHIIVGNGSTELISLLIANIQAKKCLLLGPTYSEYERELNLVGCELEEYRLSASNDFAFHLDDFCHKLNDSFDFVILCNPNNPTGTALNTDELSKLFEYCKQKNIFVMIDETYIEFSSNLAQYSAISLINTFSNIMILRGISKFFAAPGLRMGYGITSNTTLLKYLIKHQNPWSLNSIGAYVAELMFQDEAHIMATKQLMYNEKMRFYQIFTHSTDFKCYNSEANFILIKLIKSDTTASEFFTYCIQKGLMLRNCDSFFHEDGEFIRFCIMLPEDNTRLIQCFKEFSQL